MNSCTILTFMSISGKEEPKIIMGAFEIRGKLEEGNAMEVKRKTDSKGGMDN